MGLIFLISLAGVKNSQFVPATTYTQSAQNAQSNDATAVQAYLAKLTEWSGTYTRAFQSIGTLSANPQIGDTSWSENMVLTLALVQSTDKEVYVYNQPASMTYIHSQMITAANHLENMVTDMTHGIDNRDPSLLRAGASELDQAGAIYKALGPQVAAIGK